MRLLGAVLLVGLSTSLAGDALVGGGDSGQVSSLNTRCAEIARNGDALLKDDPTAKATASSILRGLQEGLASCRAPEVSPQTRARVLLIASKIGEASPPESSLPLLEEAREVLAAEAPRTKEHVRVLEELSNTKLQLERFTESRTALEEALELRESLWGPSSPEAIDGQLALVYYDLSVADIRPDLGSLESALTRAQSLLEVSQRQFGTDASVTTRVWAALSATQRAMGNEEGAQALFEARVLPHIAHLDEPLREVPQD